MALYSLDKPSSILRVSGQVIVPDTSYLIPLRHNVAKIHGIVSTFHSDAQAAGAEFFINVVIRHEQLRDARKRQLVAALKSLIAANNAIETRYRSLPEFNADQRTIDEIIEQGSEYLLKHHIKAGDDGLVYRHMTDDVMAEYLRFETASGLTYMSGTWETSWQDLGALMNTSHMEPTDAMIVNFAKFIEAQAIVTNDIGFSAVAGLMDVYMPERLARQCKGVYDQSADR